MFIDVLSNYGIRRSRMMAAPLNLPRQSATSVAKKIYQENGVRGFFRGLTPILLRAFPVNASALFAYEGLMRLMGAEKVSLSHPYYRQLIDQFVVTRRELSTSNQEVSFKNFSFINLRCIYSFQRPIGDSDLRF